MKRTAALAFFFLLISAGLFSGCFALPQEEDTRAPAFFELPSVPPWRTVYVNRGTVELFSTLVARHEPAQEEVLRFNVGNELVTGVYVNLGDEVTAGDIIASLNRTGVGNELARIRRDEERLLLRIEQLEERHAHALQTAEITETPVDDSFYIRSLADMREDLYMLRLELDYVHRQYESRLIRASVSGVVTRVMQFAPNIRSVVNAEIAAISDHTLSFFVVTQREADTLEYGERFIMAIEGTEMWVEVINPDEWGITRQAQAWEERLFMVDGGGMFAPRAIGHIRAVFAVADDVLFVPNATINRVGIREFVFVLEDGIRRMRFVQTGLVGNRYTEITGGLQEGERIVR